MIEGITKIDKRTAEICRNNDGIVGCYNCKASESECLEQLLMIAREGKGGDAE